MTFEQLAAYSLAAIRNARRLHRAAATLHDAEQHSPAFVLAGLAADEYGKHFLSFAFGAWEGTDDDWKRLWKGLNAHTVKLRRPADLLWLLGGDPATELTAEQLHRERMSATYVDLGADGTVVEPAIEAERVKQVLSHLDQVIQLAERNFGTFDPASLGVIMEKTHATRVWEMDVDEMLVGAVVLDTMQMAMMLGERVPDREELVAQARRVVAIAMELEGVDDDRSLSAARDGRAMGVEAQSGCDRSHPR